MNEHLPYRTLIVCPLPPADYSEPQRRDYCRFKHEDDIIRVFESLGFRNIQSVRTPDNSPNSPDYTALRHNRPCCIYMPEVALNVMRINHLSAEQCWHCETHHPEADVYFSALYLSSIAELKLLEPKRIRRCGSWMDTEIVEQFLPFPMRRYINRFAPLLGGAHVFKLICIIIPFLMNMGTKARFRITGTTPGNAYQVPQPPYTVQLVESSHSIFVLLHAEQGMQPRLVRSLFYHEEIAHCEMELCSLTNNTHTSIVELSGPAEHTLRADCLETIVIPEYVPIHRCYNWSLSLVAETCKVCNIGTPIQTEQCGNSPYINLTGKIIRLHEMKVCERPITMAELQFIPGDTTRRICVYLATEVTAPYTPSLGDTICCTGVLGAAPRSLTK